MAGSDGHAAAQAPSREAGEGDRLPGPPLRRTIDPGRRHRRDALRVELPGRGGGHAGARDHARRGAQGAHGPVERRTVRPPWRTLQGRRRSPEQEWRAIFYPPPLQRPRIPIWVGGTWPIKAPFRRATRWDGAFPIKVENGRIVPMTPEDAREVARYVTDHRAGSDPFELVVAGETPGEDPKKAARLLAAYREAGVTWWIESIDPWRFGWTGSESWPSEEMRRRVCQGPPEA